MDQAMQNRIWRGMTRDEQDAAAAIRRSIEHLKDAMQFVRQADAGHEVVLPMEEALEDLKRAQRAMWGGEV